MTVVIGPRRQAPPVRRPAGFEPAYDAFEPRFKTLDEVVLVIFGVEVRRGNGAEVRDSLLAALRADGGPDLLEHGVVKEGFGPGSHVWFGYWRGLDGYENWRKRSGIENLFDDPGLLTGDVGVWREYCCVSLDHNETSYSRQQNVTGIANLCDALEVTPVHGYWGSARDRIVAAAEGSLPAGGRPRPVASGHSLGARLKIQAPHNACLIKTTQDLFLANEEQLATYRQGVEPALHAGLQFLRNHPLDTGCIGLRFIEEAVEEGVPGQRTLAIAYFDSLGSLEEWTHHHSTHQAIMQQFVGMVERFEGQPGLHLWHEVTVFEAGRLTGDYVNCSPDGTLLQSETVD